MKRQSSNGKRKQKKCNNPIAKFLLSQKQPITKKKKQSGYIRNTMIMNPRFYESAPISPSFQQKRPAKSNPTVSTHHTIN